MIKLLNDKRILISMMVLQTLTLIAVYVSWQPSFAGQMPETEVLAESQVNPNQIYSECLARPVSEREVCAREIGQNLSADTGLSNSEKVTDCMKLRPVFVKYCLEELNAGFNH